MYVFRAEVALHFFLSSSSCPTWVLIFKVSTLKSTSLFTITLVSLAVAVSDFGIGADVTVTAKNAAQLATLTRAYIDAIKSFQASATAQPEWLSTFSALIEYQKQVKTFQKMSPQQMLY